MKNRNEKIKLYFVNKIFQFADSLFIFSIATVSDTKIFRLRRIM